MLMGDLGIYLHKTKLIYKSTTKYVLYLGKDNLYQTAVV